MRGKQGYFRLSQPSGAFPLLVPQRALFQANFFRGKPVTLIRGSIPSSGAPGLLSWVNCYLTKHKKPEAEATAITADDQTRARKELGA